jgi:ubiquinone biosynthesis protein Coq4
MTRLEMIREATALLRVPETMGDGAVLKSLAFSTSGPRQVRQALAPLEGFVADIDPEALARMPEGSFGLAVHRFCADNKITLLRPRMTARLREVSKDRMVAVRYAATHDLVHVLIEEGADYAGEAAVYGWACAQGYSAMHWVAFILTCSLWPLLKPWQALRIWSAAIRGYKKGQQAPMLLAIRFEDRLAEPLVDVRRELQLDSRAAG